MSFDLHLNHLQGAAQNAAQNVGIPQLVLCPSIVGKLDKIGQRVFFEDKRKLPSVAGPVRNGRGYVEEDLEANLQKVSERPWR